MSFDLHLGDCLVTLKTLPDNSIDSIVTDPPYGLSFMGKKWDYDVPSVETWAECLRVLKPGGHLLAFAGTRTQHRMAVRIEDAGFEIRDMIAWVYGSGFPKSLDVSKAIDKCNGETGRLLKFTEWMRTTGLAARQIDKITETNMGGHYLTAASQPAIPTPALWALLRPHCGDVPEWVDQLVQRIEAEREVIGTKKAIPGVAFATTGPSELAITAPATPEAQQWAGWGTALKPALEPITMARKPLDGTVAANVLTWGTGGVNVDASRVGGAPGRWPANLIHDGSDEVVAGFPQTKSGTLTPDMDVKASSGWAGGSQADRVKSTFIANEGSAARFFYCAKASKRDRNVGCESMPLHVAGGMSVRRDGSMGSTTYNNNKHPTVKPTDLMRYLCRLVTPPGGVVLDPFMGSGSTGKAAMLEGFRFVGCEMSPEYLEIARARIAHALYGDLA